MSTENTAQDPMEFMRNMWSKMGFSLPGMVTPTLDVDELDKRIADMKAVENWLKMNLNTLQMATQGLEMQRATIAAMQAMSKVAAESGSSEGGQANPFAAGMWPWNLMQGAAADVAKAATDPAPATPAKGEPRTASNTPRPRRPPGLQAVLPSSVSQAVSVTAAATVVAEISQATPGPSPPMRMARM
jgi:hypothetical protein